MMGRAKRAILVTFAATVAWATLGQTGDAAQPQCKPPKVLRDGLCVYADEMPKKAGPKSAQGRGSGSAAKKTSHGGMATPRRATPPAPPTESKAGAAVSKRESASARSPLQRYNDGRIVLRSDSAPEHATGWASKLAGWLPQAEALVASLSGAAIRLDSLQVYLFDTQERYQDYAREHAPGLINNGGFFDGGMRTVATYRLNNSLALPLHLSTYALLGQLYSDFHFERWTRRDWPIWLDVGIAEYAAAFETVDGSLRVPAVSASKVAYCDNAIESGSFLSLENLFSARKDDFSGKLMNLYYSESWALVHYLASDVDRAMKLRSYVVMLRDQKDPNQARRLSFGDDLRAIESGLRAHVRALAREPAGPIKLFDGTSIDGWTVHEGGNWRVVGGEIVAAGDGKYNYLIKATTPLRSFTLELEVNIARGTGGLILGNQSITEYPYHYLIDLARDSVSLRRATSAAQIDNIMQAYADLGVNQWVPIRVDVKQGALTVFVGGREVLTARGDQARYSLFGMYLLRAEVKFRNIRVTPVEVR